MGRLYDSDYIREFYDRYGMKEWDRWDLSPVQAVKFHVHLHYLRQYVYPNDRVLEIGAGAGRFTRELSSIAGRIVVGDISPLQLELNRRQSHKFGYSNSIESYVECDAVDLSSVFPDATFDAVVCYGGVLSYALDRREDAVRELARVMKGDGHILFSVMNLFGTIHQFLPQVMAFETNLNRRVIDTGDITGAEAALSEHRHHMFRSRELRELIESCGLEVEIMSASNSLSAVWNRELFEIKTDEARWQQLLEMEVEAAAEPGCLDMGTHVIAVCRKP